MATKCEFLFPKINRRATRMMQAMIESCPIPYEVTQSYQGRTDFLMTYGLGLHERAEAAFNCLERGGNFATWDIGYWNRHEFMRLSINHHHCYRLVKDMPPDRFEKSGLEFSNTHDPSGHILLAGLGRKSRFHRRYNGLEWEIKIHKKLSSLYPCGKIVYKPKKPEISPWPAFTGNIKEALNGCRFVVCHHSNVAIDAALQGIPCVIWDGIGASFYGNDLRAPFNPTEQQRRQFLNNVAYWQYKPSEAETAWQFILDTIYEN